MKARIKHILFTLCVLVSFNQSIHSVSHIFSSHDNTKKEIVHLKDHKCQLCQIDVQSILDGEELVEFTWTTLPKHKNVYHFFQRTFPSITQSTLYLRGPPYLI